MLANKRFDDGERLTRTRSTHNPRTAKRVNDVHPSLPELAFIVVAHGNIDRVFVLLLILTLLKAFVLEVEAVF